MLVQYIPALSQRRIILASASPRRQELLTTLGLKFEIIKPAFDELLPKSQFPGGAQYAIETARHKALEVAQIVADGQVVAPGQMPPPPADLIISADTVVEHEGQVLEKPDDAEHAFRMLSRLSGSQHFVHTGVTLVLPRAVDPQKGQGPFVRTFAVTTTVHFDVLTPETIRAYIATGEPFGKAGSYAIQGIAGSFAKSIDGCFFTVMGFPLHRFCAELSRLIRDGHLPLNA